jgi:transcriptional regulator with XRE-family HTH domain
MMKKARTQILPVGTSGAGYGAETDGPKSERGADPPGAVASAEASLGARIRRRRQDRQLRLIDLAGLTNLSVSFISQMERGLTEPSMRSLIRIADALGTTAHVLMDDTPQSEKRWSVTRAESTTMVPNDSGTARSMIEANPAIAAFDFVGGPLGYFTYYALPTDNVLLVLSGRFEIDVEGELASLEAGDAVFIKRGVSHRWRRQGGPKSRLISVIHATGSDLDASGPPPGP